MIIETPTSSLERRIIECGIAVHRVFGPGLFESIYEAAFCIELKDQGLTYTRQIALPVLYKGQLLGEHRPDVIVENQVVVEIKSIDRLAPVHTAQMLTYLRLAELHVGLILNFNNAVLTQGIKRVLR